MIANIFLIIIVIFFAINMGASGIAPSFAPIYGAKFIKKREAIIFFTGFVILGALLLGRNVVLTLGTSLVPRAFINFKVALIIIGSATLGLFIANIFKIPQSTSQVSVSAIIGVGLFLKQLNFKTFFLKILPMWVILPVLSFVFTLLIYNKFYPPQKDNLHIYQRLFSNGKKMKLSALVVSCYVAFAIGTNNVANAVGPLFGARILEIIPGLILISPLFGLGAYILGKGNLETAGKEIIPLGIFSSALVSFVTATLLIIASFLGIPQSLVQLNIASIFAISCLKDGHKYTWDRSIVHKTFSIWIITPLMSISLAYALSLLFLAK